MKYIFIWKQIIPFVKAKVRFINASKAFSFIKFVISMQQYNDLALLYALFYR